MGALDDCGPLCQETLREIERWLAPNLGYEPPLRSQEVCTCGQVHEKSVMSRVSVEG